VRLWAEPAAPAKSGDEKRDAGVDSDLLADALLAPLSADLYRHQRRVLGISAKRIRDTVIRVREAVSGGSATP
jgi:hypothetical protein